MTLSEETFSSIEKKGNVPHAEAIPKIGKLFLDFGLHAPTVAFPEVYGLMVEPTESYTKAELDRFIDIVKAIFKLITETPQVLQTVPHFTPVNKIDEVGANKNPVFAEKLTKLPTVYEDRVDVAKINQMSIGEICKMILEAHQKAKGA
jgi:glycine dehydrogenase